MHAPRAKVVRTAAGRAVSVYEYGDPAGEPVIALHGTPACGAGFTWADTAARERGLRIIAPDRPGVGRSDPIPMRAVADYPTELVAVADVLGIDRFSVLGYSGGGPYAVAAAHALPDRILSVQLAAPAGQIGVWATLADLDRTDRQLTWLSLHAKWLARAEMRAALAIAVAAPRFSAWWLATGLPAADKQAMRAIGPPRAAQAMFTEALTQGAGGVVDDYALLSKPWGFRVEEVGLPIDCWHGTADTLVPLDHTHALISRLPDARLTTWPDEGHFAVITHISELLDRITERTRR